MFDENEHIHPQNNDEGPRHIHRGIKRSEPDEVEVDSADFFPANSGSRCTPASPPPLTTNFRKEEWSCWYCRPS